MLTKSRVFLSKIIVILVLPFFFLGCDRASQPEKVKNDKTIRPGFELSKAYFRETFGEGVRWELKAEGASFYERDDVGWLKEPRASYYPESGEIVYLRSHLGKFTNNFKQLELQKDVVVSSDDGITLYTEALTWRGKEKKVWSKGKVRISSANMELTANRLEADIQLQKLRLYGDIKTTVY